MTQRPMALGLAGNKRIVGGTLRSDLVNLFPAGGSDVFDA